MAKKAIEKAGKDTDWEYHAALAAAHAEVGEFEAAVAEQQKSISIRTYAVAPLGSRRVGLVR